MITEIGTDANMSIWRRTGITPTGDRRQLAKAWLRCTACDAPMGCSSCWEELKTAALKINKE